MYVCNVVHLANGKFYEANVESMVGLCFPAGSQRGAMFSHCHGRGAGTHADLDLQRHVLGLGRGAVVTCVLSMCVVLKVVVSCSARGLGIVAVGSMYPSGT